MSGPPGPPSSGKKSVLLRLNEDIDDEYSLFRRHPSDPLVVFLDHRDSHTFELHKDVCRVEKRLLDVPTVEPNKKYAETHNLAPSYYAEFRIVREDGATVDSRTTSLFGFGIGRHGYDLAHFIGWDSDSIGFHCDDCSVFRGSGMPYRMLTVPHYQNLDEHKVGVLYDTYSGSVSFLLDGISLIVLHNCISASSFDTDCAFFISHEETQPVGRLGVEVHLPGQDVYASSFALPALAEA